MIRPCLSLRHSPSSCHKRALATTANEGCANYALSKAIRFLLSPVCQTQPSLRLHAIFLIDAHLHNTHQGHHSKKQRHLRTNGPDLSIVPYSLSITKRAIQHPPATLQRSSKTPKPHACQETNICTDYTHGQYRNHQHATCCNCFHNDTMAFLSRVRTLGWDDRVEKLPHLPGEQNF